MYVDLGQLTKFDGTGTQIIPGYNKFLPIFD